MTPFLYVGLTLNEWAVDLDKTDKATPFVEEALASARVVSSCGMEDHEVALYKQELDKQSAVKKAKLVPVMVYMFVVYIGYIFCLW